MANVYLNIHGDGRAWTNNPEPTIDDPVFTVTCDPEESFIRAQAWTHNDEPIATPQTPVFTMTWIPYWGNTYIDIYFRGSDPPPEPPEPSPTTEAWFWPVLFNHQKKRRRMQK